MPELSAGVAGRPFPPKNGNPIKSGSEDFLGVNPRYTPRFAATQGLQEGLRQRKARKRNLPVLRFSEVKTDVYFKASLAEADCCREMVVCEVGGGRKTTKFDRSLKNVS
jgi:hypothetical protein